MHLRRLISGSFVAKSLPTKEQWAQEASRLAEKRAAQIEWMERRGINIRLKESERPRPPQKPPLPGTVIFFSRTH